MSDVNESGTLRRELRSGDPAAGASLNPEELARMRREMLAAVPEEGSHPWMWRWAVAAAAVAAIAAGFLWWQANDSRGSRSSPAVADARFATADRQGKVADSPREAAVVGDEAERKPEAHESIPSMSDSDTESQLRTAQRLTPDPPGRGAGVVSAPVKEAEQAPRALQQLRLVAPDGTQIVWVLNPRFELDGSEANRTERNPI